MKKVYMFIEEIHFSTFKIDLNKHFDLAMNSLFVQSLNIFN